MVEPTDRPVSSDHKHLLLAAEQEPELVDHGLHRVLEVGTHLLKFTHVGKLERQQSWPPTDRQVLAVHTVQFAVLRHSAKNAT